MGIVLVSAVGLAAWRNADEPWAGAMLLLTWGILCMAIVSAIYCKGGRRAWWLGFAVFGWGYLALLRYSRDWGMPLNPLRLLLDMVQPWMAPPPQPPVGMFGGGGGGGGFGGSGGGPSWWALIVQCLWTLLIASIGGFLSWFFFASSRDGPDAPAVGDPTRSRWLRPTITGLVVLIVGAAATAILSGSHASFWAGLTFLLTEVFLGLTALGAVLDRSLRRPRWLGAALFGLGYAALIFSRPVTEPPGAYLATDQVLKALRPWLASAPKSLSAENARILEALERPIQMKFANETPLDDVLKYIKQATTTPTFNGIPIYVDPIGFQEAQRSMNSTVQIDLEGVPLRATLALCLRQLGLGYEVKDGFVRITAERNLSTSLDDPFLIVGHCLLALLAAGLGAVTAPIVAGAGQPSAGRTSGPVGEVRPT